MVRGQNSKIKQMHRRLKGRKEIRERWKLPQLSNERKFYWGNVLPNISNHLVDTVRFVVYDF